MLHSSSSPSIPISATFLCLLAASVGTPLVAAAENNVTIDYLYQKINPTAAAPGFNVEGGSVFTNVANTINEGQFFFIYTANNVFEKPGSDLARTSGVSWCSDLTFSDINNSSLIGYAGRCVVRSLSLAGYNAAVASGAQVSYDYSGGEFDVTVGVSAVFVEQQNIFQGQFHMDTDDNTYRYWDDGRKTAPYIGWEGHDEGDMSPNAATASYSMFGKMTWMSVEEVAQLFNTSVDEFTPEIFKQIYLDTWIKNHEFEAAEKNPNPLPELEIIEQVKNETNSATPAQPDRPVDDVGSDPVVIDDSGSGRQLMSVGARFVSAALRVFGI